MSNTTTISGWSVISDTSGVDLPDTPRRRTRHQQKEALKLRRDDDGLELVEGDTILIQERDSESPEVALVKEIRHGDLGHVVVLVTWFLRYKDVASAHTPPNTGEHDVFITAYTGAIKTAEVVDKVSILSQDEFRDFILDDSTRNTTFVCLRGCDLEGALFTDVFDYRELHLQFLRDSNAIVESIRLQTVKLAYSRGSARSSPVKAPKPVHKKPVYVEISDEDEDDDDDEYEDAEEEFHEAEEDVHMSEDEILEASETQEPEVQDDELLVSDDEPSTPRKRRARATPTHKRLKHDPKRDFVYAMLSPLKNGVKFKTSPVRNLPVLSPRRTNKTSDPLGVDASSLAFKQLREKLHTSAHVASLPCREDEFASIYLNLESAIQEQTGCCIYVSGTPGVGKTATIREVIEHSKEIASIGELNAFDYVEINGLKLITPNSAYDKLWEKISGTRVSPSNAALLLESYFNTEDKDRKPLVVLMDELDQVVTKSQSVMYNFFNWPTYAHSKLIVIAVANTMDLPERVLSNKISSRLGLRRIQFIGYSYQDLGEIVRHRLSMLTKQNRRKVVVNEDAIGFASRKVASVSGDARRALAICRRAVEIAEADFLKNRGEKEVENDEEEAFTVSLSHISKAINETVSSPTFKFLEALPFAAKLVLVGILLRMKRLGLAENTLGDIIDEMQNSLPMLTSKESNRVFEEVDPRANFVSLLYGSGLVDGKAMNIRVQKFKHIVAELVENGVLMQQNVRSERYRLVHLNVSEEEVLSAIREDRTVGTMV